jgi:centromeric protein E
LASSAAVELKNLAEEVTKLSVQNAKQAKELLAAQEMAHSRVNGRKDRITSRGRDEVGTWSLDLEDMKMELQARRQRLLWQRRNILKRSTKESLTRQRKRNYL